MLFFVVMQSSQVDSVLPSIAENTKSPMFVFVGNESRAKEVQEKVKNISVNKNAKILFGFFSLGGRRENGKVISVHTNCSDFDIGDLDGNEDYKTVMENIFKKSKFKVNYHDNMDDFFKTHIAFIMPLAYLSYMTDCDLRKAVGNKEILNSTLMQLEKDLTY